MIKNFKILNNIFWISPLKGYLLEKYANDITLLTVLPYAKKIATNSHSC